MECLSPESRSKAWEELNEKTDSVTKNCRILRNLLQNEKDLVCPSNDDFLLRFLRARKHNPEKAFKLLKQYYTMRRNHMELFKELCPLALKPVLEKRLQYVIPIRDKEGRQIFVFRAGVWDAYSVSLDDIFRANYLYLEEMIASEETQVNGIIAIVDFAGLGWSHVRSFTPRQAQRVISLVQDCFPARFKEFHFVHQPYVFQCVFAIVKPLLSEKIRNRIHFHGMDTSELLEKVGKQHLPTYLGGDAEEDDGFLNQLYSRNEYYKQMCELGYGSSPF